MKLQHTLSALALAAMAISAAPTFAATGTFVCVTSDCSVGETTTSWDLTGNALTIFNTGAASSFIRGLDFALGTGMSVNLNATQMAGVDFEDGGVGANLPASLGWTITDTFTADSPGSTNGVNGGEQLDFTVTGVTLADIGTNFKFGIHLQGLTTTAGSEKLIAVAPEPETYALMLAGLGVVGFMARRRKTA